MWIPWILRDGNIKEYRDRQQAERLRLSPELNWERIERKSSMGISRRGHRGMSGT